MRIVIAAAACLCSIGVTVGGRARADEARPGQQKLEAALREVSAAACPGRQVAIDPDLTRAAIRYVQAVQAGRAQADGGALSFFASLESIDPAPAGGVATVDNAAQADRALGDLLPHGCRYTLAGAAATKLANGHGVVAVLTAARVLSLAAIPAQVEPGASVRLDGALGAGLTQPRLYHLGPGGTVEETPLPLEGRRFQLEVALAQPGEHALELLADGTGGPEVIALRRIFVGVAQPVEPPPAQTAAPVSSGEGLSQVEQAIARLRAARGLPPLTRDAALDAVAAGHSREMARTQTFAHVLPSDASLVERLLHAGYAHRYAGENIGLAEDAPTAHAAIEESPAHLMNLLDPRHSRLGLGAASGLSPDGERAVYLTEVLAQPILGSSDPASEVATTLFSERKKRKLPALVRDPRLDAMALARLRTLVAAQGKMVAPDLTHQALDQISSLTSAAAEWMVLGAPDDARLSKDVGGRDWAVLGVGALYASSKEYGPDRLWVLLLYAR